MVASRQFKVCSAIESKQATIHLICEVWKRARGSNMERDITLYNAIGVRGGVHYLSTWAVEELKPGL